MVQLLSLVQKVSCQVRQVHFSISRLGLMRPRKNREIHEGIL